MSLRKPRVVVAGQVPPPFGGQNLMVQKVIAQFAASERCELVHLPFFFTPTLESARRGDHRKAFELLRVIARLVRIRLQGPIDVLLYPTGGPQKVAMIRDLLLLPWILLCSRRVVLHFHAAGIAEQLEPGASHFIPRLLRPVYRWAFAAIVMTDFNRRDPRALGIKRILQLPWRVQDDFDSRLVVRQRNGAVRLLYVGNLCADKGTPQLMEAFAVLRQNHPELELELVGECLPPFTQRELRQLIDDLDLRSCVHLSGLLTGAAKAEAFGRADLFVFPTIAPYESFGLVLAEAMAWKLPIVTTKWRGNPDVLTPDAGAISFPVTAALPRDLAAALAQALQKRVEWQEWGARNRSIFEKHYRENEEREWLLEPLLSLLQPRAAGLRRILYVHNSADRYGASRSLLRLLPRLDRSRFEPHVILPEEGPLRPAIEALGVPLVVDPSLSVISRYAPWLACFRFPISVWRLYRFIREEEIDLVHTNTGVVLSPGLAARLAGVPHVWHMRESFRATQPRLWTGYSKYIHWASDRIIAVSNAVGAQFSNRSKVRVIHNGFSLEEFAVPADARAEFRRKFNIAEGDLVTGCVGRIKWARKGQEHLIQAAHLLKNRGVVSRYLIVGSPYPGNESHLVRLEQLVRDLDLRDETIFTAELPDARPAYAAMDILVLPSALPEPFGGVVMEAMAMGLPVVATNIGGSLDQVVEGVTGFLVPPGDSEALAAKIELLARDPELRRKMGAAGRDRIATSFSLTESARRIQGVYESVLAEHAGRGRRARA